MPITFLKSLRSMNFLLSFALSICPTLAFTKSAPDITAPAQTAVVFSPSAKTSGFNGKYYTANNQDNLQQIIDNHSIKTVIINAGEGLITFSNTLDLKGADIVGGDQIRCDQNMLYFKNSCPIIEVPNNKNAFVNQGVEHIKGGRDPQIMVHDSSEKRVHFKRVF